MGLYAAKFSIFIGVFFIFNISHAEFKLEFKCESLEIITLKSGQYIKNTTKSCYDLEQRVFLSEKCHNDKCDMLKKLKASKLKIKDIFSEYNNPGFSLCAQLGFKAKIVSYKSDKFEIKSDMCQSLADESFSSTNYLVHLLMSRDK